MTKKKYYQRPDGLFETSRTVNGKRIFFRGKTCAEIDRKILAYSAEKKLGRKVPIIADEWFAAKEEEGIRQGILLQEGFRKGIIIEEGFRKGISVRKERIREGLLRKERLREGLIL